MILRTDWESLDGHTAFDTPNRINLHAGAALLRDLQTLRPAPISAPGSTGTGMLARRCRGDGAR